MKVQVEVEVFDAEPRYCLRCPALPKEKYVAAGNPKAVGRQLMKLIERLADKQGEAT